MEPVSTGESVSKAISKINCAFLVQFLVVVKTNEFRAPLSIDMLYEEQFLKRILFSNTVLAKKIADLMKAKASASSKP